MCLGHWIKQRPNQSIPCLSGADTSGRNMCREDSSGRWNSTCEDSVVGRSRVLLPHPKDLPNTKKPPVTLPLRVFPRPSSVPWIISKVLSSALGALGSCARSSALPDVEDCHSRPRPQIRLTLAAPAHSASPLDRSESVGR